MRVDYEDLKKRCSSQMASISLEVQLQTQLVPTAAAFFAAEWALLKAAPDRYVVERDDLQRAFNVRRRMGPRAFVFTASLSEDLTAARCVCADNAQRGFVCRHIIAVYLTFRGCSLSTVSRLIPLFAARYHTAIARTLVDKVWPEFLTGNAPPTNVVVLHQLQFSLVGADNGGSGFTPEYRDNMVSSLIQALSVVAEDLPDDRLSRFVKASWVLLTEFSTASRSRVSVNAGSSLTEEKRELVIRNPEAVGRAKTKALEGTAGKAPSARQSAFGVHRRAGQVKQKGSYGCGNCGQGGHKQSTCPQPCSRCGETGHTLKACKSKRVQKRKQPSCTPNNNPINNPNNPNDPNDSNNPNNRNNHNNPNNPSSLPSLAASSSPSLSSSPSSLLALRPNNTLNNPNNPNNPVSNGPNNDIFIDGADEDAGEVHVCTSHTAPATACIFILIYIYLFKFYMLQVILDRSALVITPVSRIILSNTLLFDQLIYSCPIY